MMKQLVMKDIRLLWLINILIVISGVVVGCIGVDINYGRKVEFVYGIAMVLMIYMVSMYLTNYDVKYKSDILLNLFPVSRYDIVKARYISMTVYIISITGIVFLSSNIFNLLFYSSSNGTPATIGNVLLVIGLSLVFFSFYIPFHYYSIGKAQIFNQIFYIIIILIPNVMMRFSNKLGNLWIFRKMDTLNSNMIMPILLTLGVLMYILSIQVSRSIYAKKDF